MANEIIIEDINKYVIELRIFYYVIYKHNMKNLKAILADQPQTSLERTVWWTEHVLRHKNSRHLLGAAAQISWSDYLMLDVLILLAVGFDILADFTLTVVIYVLKLVLRTKSHTKVKQQ